CKLILSIHDWIWFEKNKFNQNKSNSNKSYFCGYLEEKIEINNSVKEIFNNCDFIIHPSNFTYLGYSKYFNKSKFILCPHIDYKVINNITSNIILENKINLGMMCDYTDVKGKEFIKILQDKYSNKKYIQKNT